jgi:hypothetical protein
MNGRGGKRASRIISREWKEAGKSEESVNTESGGEA